MRSLYLYRHGGRGFRPVAVHWGWHGGSRTQAVERALTDFGCEESFGQASRRFREHYGFEVGRTTISKVVATKAQCAEKLLKTRFEDAALDFDLPLSARPGEENLLIELDGCEIRTGTLQPPLPGAELTPKRKLASRKRTEAWRDVRVGLARPLGSTSPTYVAKMAPYPVVVQQLFGAACLRGLSARTKTTAVADGGNGLYEELCSQFPGLAFILDRPHAKHHIYEAAQACGLSEAERHPWVARHLVRLDQGNVEEVLADLSQHKGRGKARVLRLLRYLTRFKTCFNYDAAKKAGLPIGSGEIESAHRTIPQKRMKLPGAFWHPTSINPMLALRVLRANDWWVDLWPAA